MLAKRIIPCLDLNKGRVVKGVNFVNLVDAGDPVECAAAYDRAGADEIVFLDITASHERRGITLDVVRRTAEQCFMPVTIGGGLRTLDDINAMLRAGADKVSLNTPAVERPEFVGEASRRFGSQCIVVAIDARRRNQVSSLKSQVSSLKSAIHPAPSTQHPAPEWEVFTHGGRTPTGLDAIEWARKAEALGAGEILLTSMDADGTQAGYDLALTAAVSDAVHIPVIASGGVGTLEHLVEAFTAGHADAALAASIFHFGKYTIGEAKRYLAERGIPVRPVAADTAA